MAPADPLAPDNPLAKPEAHTTTHTCTHTLSTDNPLARGINPGGLGLRPPDFGAEGLWGGRGGRENYIL